MYGFGEAQPPAIPDFDSPFKHHEMFGIRHDAFRYKGPKIFKDIFPPRVDWLLTEDAGRASAFHTVSAQLLCFVKRSVGPGEGLDHGLARPVLCHSD